MIVTSIIHGLHLDDAESGRVCDRSTGHAGEDDGGDDVYLAETTRPVTDTGIGEGEDTIRDATRVHEITGQNEERNRQHRETGGAVIDTLRHNSEDFCIAQRREDTGTGDAHRDADRHADQHESDEYNNCDKCYHWNPLS